MRAYKLKKWYPSLCKTWLTGTIVQKDKDGYYQSDYFHSNVNTDEDHLGIYWSEVENNPEFWEEIVEKTFEIIKLICTSDSSNGKPSEFYKDGMVKWGNGKDGEEYNYITDLLETGDYSIYSVKRLSDNEIFTIGDEIIGCLGYKFKIIGFALHESDTILVNYDGNSDMGFKLSNIKKHIVHIDPILVTEDGVEIFQGDFVYYVLSNLSLRNYKPTRDDRDLNNHYFSTEEKAREYIKLNEKRYSINDLFGMICPIKTIIDGGSFSGEVIFEGILKSDLEKL